MSHYPRGRRKGGGTIAWGLFRFVAALRPSTEAADVRRQRERRRSCISWSITVGNDSPSRRRFCGMRNLMAPPDSLIQPRAARHDVQEDLFGRTARQSGSGRLRFSSNLSRVSPSRAGTAARIPPNHGLAAEVSDSELPKAIFVTTYHQGSDGVVQVIRPDWISRCAGASRFESGLLVPRTSPANN